ncbi:MAG: hypothetical protein WCZ85_03630, partial [Bacilli bacterium]
RNDPQMKLLFVLDKILGCLFVVQDNYLSNLLVLNKNIISHCHCVCKEIPAANHRMEVETTTRVRARY